MLTTIIVLSTLLVVLIPFTAWVCYASWTKGKALEWRIPYMAHMESEVDVLHGRITDLNNEVRRGERVIAHQLDTINNLKQGQANLMYLLDPSSVQTITSQYDA